MPLYKVSVIDRHADTVRFRIAGHLGIDPTKLEPMFEHMWQQVLQVARARHILGHYEYGDTNLFEWTDGKVRAAIIEELADAVVYQAWLEERAATP